MNVWEHFQIKSVSPAQINSFAEEPARWFAKTIRKVSEDIGPAGWRGDAVEFGFYTHLMGRDAAAKAAYVTYDKRAEEYAEKHNGEVPKEFDAERANIERCLERAIAAADKEGLGQPLTYNQPLEGYLPDYEKVKFWQKPDFGYDGFTLDLKTSSRIPSAKDGAASPKPEHAVAFACYATVRGDKEARALYVSTAEKPSNPYVLVTMNEYQVRKYAHYAAHMLRSMERRMLAAIAMSEYEAVEPVAALAELCMPNTLAQGGGVYPVWKEDYLRMAVDAVPEWGI